MNLSDAAQQAKKYGKGMRNDSIAKNITIFPTDDINTGCIAVLHHSEKKDQAIPHWSPNLHALTDDSWYVVGC